MTPKYPWMRPILAVLFSCTFLGLAIGLTVAVFALDGGWDAMPVQVQNIYVGLVQALIVMVTAGFGFYFGTTQGSANKSETIDRIVNSREPEPPTDEDS